MLDSLYHLGALLAFTPSDWSFLAGVVMASVVIGACLLAGLLVNGGRR